MLKRDNYTCQHCGSPGSDVDHVIPRSQGGLDALPNLQVLCGCCHDVKTKRDRKS